MHFNKQKEITQMKSIVKGAIFYADLGKTVGSEESGIRPVLVIQNDTGNRFSPTTIVAPISTKKNENLPTHILVKQFDKIRHDSIIMLEQIRVIDKARLKGFVGILTDQDIQKVNKGIMVSLGLK